MDVIYGGMRQYLRLCDPHHDVERGVVAVHQLEVLVLHEGTLDRKLGTWAWTFRT